MKPARIGVAYKFAANLRKLGDAFIAEAEPLAVKLMALVGNQDDEEDLDLLVPGFEQWMVWCDARNVLAPERTPRTDICDVYHSLMSVRSSAETSMHAWLRKGRKDVAAQLDAYSRLCRKYALLVAAL